MPRVILFCGPLLVLAIAAPARAVDDKQIKASIAGAIKFLKANVGRSAEGDEGPMALAGLALLEAGVDPADPAIQQIARVVREASIRQSKTYQLALNIMFLDRLGEDIDVKLIQSMGVRLKFGLTQLSGWTYECPGPDQR